MENNEENKQFAEYYQKKAEESVSGYGNIVDSMIVGGAYQLKSYGYSGNARSYAEKLEKVKKEMRELDCE